MLFSVDFGDVGNEKFAGSEGLGKGPETLDWQTISGAKPKQPKAPRRAYTVDWVRPSSQIENAIGEKPHGLGDTGRMTDITREEFNARLETIEVKMDARVQAVTSKIDGFLAAQDERDKRLDLLLAQISKDSGESKTSISSMKTTLIVTAVSTVLAIVIGVASFNTALTSNMMSAFQLGANRSDSVHQETPSSPPTATEPVTAPETKAPASPPPNTSNEKARH